MHSAYIGLYNLINAPDLPTVVSDLTTVRVVPDLPTIVLDLPTIVSEFTYHCLGAQIS